MPTKSGNKASRKRETRDHGPLSDEPPIIMRLLQTLSIFAFGLLVSAVQSPKELEIKTTYTPSDCAVKAQKGDSIKVHYVRSCFHSRALNVLRG